MGDEATESPPPALPHDRMVTPERSVFGTRLPRPTGVGRHLIVVVLFSLIALAVAIVFAERDTAAASSEASGDG